MPDLYIRSDNAVFVRNTYTASFIMYNVHSPNECDGQYCVIHNPSDHLMRDFDLVLRGSSVVERICPHGVGHPDPDSVSYFMRNFPDGEFDQHSCDGCCMTDEEWRKVWEEASDEPGAIIVGKGK